MTKSSLDKESYFLLVLIVFGLAVALGTELLNFNIRPIILITFIGISVTALIYKLLGGLEGSKFGTAGFKITGSAAFLIGFIYFLNPILERQTYPTKHDLFIPASNEWIPVSRSTFQPIDLKLNFMDFEYGESDFADYNQNSLLYFKPKEAFLEVYKEDDMKFKLGKIDIEKLNKLINVENQINVKNTEVFTQNTGLNERTSSRSWIPFYVQPTQFDNNTTSYQIFEKSTNKLITEGEIILRGAKIYRIDNRFFMISVHRLNHKNGEEGWARFSISELTIDKWAGINPS